MSVGTAFEEDQNSAKSCTSASECQALPGDASTGLPRPPQPCKAQELELQTVCHGNFPALPRRSTAGSQALVPYFGDVEDLKEVVRSWPPCTW